MDQQKTGSLIRALRTERHMTQKDLAETLGVTDQAVSKWERGLGCPDVSLLPMLAQALGIPMEGLLAGELEEREPDGGSMRQLKFYVCPQCGNLMTATGPACLSCCGRKLEALAFQKPDEDHRLTVEQVEDDWYLTAPHPMEKDHHLSFAALVSGDQVTVVKRWPEWDFQVRLPRRGHGMLFWYCTRHGLFRQAL
ncbi:helix-turn-helix domain-containing protein [Pseudoflavonifractor phocaeensis]|uniref:helix-turn-helix domain-containing protein n=1 Tax=Pseudoflavonifractor phocaeensis TaxID=1870988 RepID=UPI001F18B800|nr:helix-turn-helix domain-containing protein [Pseudoflavonifractor phocaeensis]MCF2596528.1 helix-turn-helix domain-containing protein [Pseudoflavonifractor phocaeensis]